jgi:hypothetical protein
MSTFELFDTAAEQLPLLELPAPTAPASRRVVPIRRRVPAKLRLDQETRRIGLVGVAEARAILAAQAERRSHQPVGRLAGRRPLVTERAA